MGENERNIGALALLLSHDLGRFRYELSGRKEISDRYESPMLFSLGAGYAVTDWYELQLNLSKNFRIPTYNDLFWRAGGNIELQPEESHQAELGQILYFRDFEFGVTGYIIQISNLLRWVPDSSGLWRPQNTEKVQNLGVEATLGWERSVGDHHLSFNGVYAYTKTKDENLDKELIYVPKHKVTTSAGYSYQDFSFYYQFLHNGRVFTTTDNRYELDSYQVSNVGVNYNFGRKDQYKIGVEVRNLFNEGYQNLPSRPMPGRSLSSSLTFKF